MTIFDQYRTMPEYVTYVDEKQESEQRLWVSIAAKGGGEVGESYARNGWLWRVEDESGLAIEGNDLFSTAPATHEQMALVLMGHLDAEAESTDPEVVERQSPEYQEFLNIHGERLGVHRAIREE